MWFLANFLIINKTILTGSKYNLVTKAINNNDIHFTNQHFDPTQKYKKMPKPNIWENAKYLN